jgi:hypothetical protein
VAAYARRKPPGSTHNTKITRTLALPNVVAEFRYGKDKVRAKAWQMWQANEHRWVDHGYLIEDCKRHAQDCLLVAETFQQFGGPGAIRTRDTRFRRAVLYPLSYGAIWSRVPGAH